MYPEGKNKAASKSSPRYAGNVDNLSDSIKKGPLPLGRRAWSAILADLSAGILLAILGLPGHPWPIFLEEPSWLRAAGLSLALRILACIHEHPAHASLAT
jgi:hypothetical protein